MNILEILKGAVGPAKVWIDELEKRQTINPQLDPWISRVNNFLLLLSPKQIDLIRDKFKDVKFADGYQLRDKLAEIIVATEYQDEQPQFLPDNSSKKTPDILLKKSQRYIEVKNFNISEEYKILLEKLRKDKEMYLERNASDSELQVKDQERYELILKYAKEQIDGGVKQLLEKDGFIYFVYSIDLSPFSLDTVDKISTRLVRDVQTHYLQREIKVVCGELSQLFK